MVGEYFTLANESIVLRERASKRRTIEYTQPSIWSIIKVVSIVCAMWTRYAILKIADTFHFVSFRISICFIFFLFFFSSRSLFWFCFFFVLVFVFRFTYDFRFVVRIFVTFGQNDELRTVSSSVFRLVDWTGWACLRVHLIFVLFSLSTLFKHFRVRCMSKEVYA